MNGTEVQSFGGAGCGFHRGIEGRQLFFLYIQTFFPLPVLCSRVALSLVSYLYTVINIATREIEIPDTSQRASRLPDL